MMEGRGKVSLASSFYSSVAAAIEVGERPTEIDVDFSHSGRRRRRRSATTHSGASERARFNQLPFPLSSLFLNVFRGHIHITSASFSVSLDPTSPLESAKFMQLPFLWSGFA